MTRTYKEGDETEIVQLFNCIHKNYAGFVPRTSDYWRWSCLKRPDVESEGILVVNDGEKIIGYAVVGKTGNIWEFCYDPAYDGNAIVAIILEWSANYVENAGGDCVVFNAPSNDQLLREVCVNLGFAEKSPPCMFLNVLDFPQFIFEILNSKRDKLVKYDEDILFKAVKPLPWYDGKSLIEIRNGMVSVNQKTDDNKPSVIIEADVSTIVSCILGTQGLLKSFFYFRIRVKPFWKSFKILKLLSLMVLKNAWFSPGADYG